MAQGVEHPSNDPLAPFTHGHLDEGRVARTIENARRHGRGRTIVEFHATRESTNRPGLDDPFDQNDVGLVHPKSRVGEPEGEVSVVGEHHESFRVGIEAPRRVDPRSLWHQVDHRRPPLWIIRGAHRSHRLVDGVVGEIRGDRKRHTIDHDSCGRRVDLLSEMRRFTIDRNATLADQDLRVAAGDETGPAYQLLKSFDDPSGRKGRSSVSTISAGGTWSASGGRSWGLLTPNFSRNNSVVP